MRSGIDVVRRAGIPDITTWSHIIGSHLNQVASGRCPHRNKKSAFYFRVQRLSTHLPFRFEYIAAKDVALPISRYVAEYLQVLSIVRDVEDPAEATQEVKKNGISIMFLDWG